MSENEYLNIIKHFISIPDGREAWSIIKLLKDERPLTLSKIDLDHKTYNDWKMKGLVDFIPTGVKRTWVRLNLSEYIWIRLVDSLRSYGVSFENLAKIKTILFVPINHHDTLFKTGFNELVNETYNLAQKAAKNITKEAILDLLTRKDIQASLKSMVEDYTLFDAIVFTAYKHKFLLQFIFVDGVLIPFCEGMTESSEFEYGIKRQSHIVIPMFGFIEDLIANKKIPGEDITRIFTVKDLKILDALKKKLNKGQKITRYDPGDFIWVEKEEPSSSNISSLLKLNENQDVKIVIRNGKREKIMREERQKLE